jgi:hypothetical protein
LSDFFNGHTHIAANIIEDVRFWNVKLFFVFLGKWLNNFCFCFAGQEAAGHWMWLIPSNSMELETG